MTLRNLSSAEHASSETADASAVERTTRERLWRTGYLPLRELSCEVGNGAVYLRGRVSSQYLKQVAQAVAVELAGARAVVNLIEVDAPTSWARLGHPGREPKNALR